MLRSRAPEHTATRLPMFAMIFLSVLAAFAAAICCPAQAHAVYLDDVLGFDREAYIASIEANWDSGSRYHNTPYKGWYYQLEGTPDWDSGPWWAQGNPSDTGVVGMNCGGFVGRTFFDMGLMFASNEFLMEWHNGAGHWAPYVNAAGSVANARSFWRAAQYYGVEMYSYNNKAELLADHKATKGDIIVMIDDNDNGGYDDWGNYHEHANDSHIGVFWGDDENYDLFRHASHDIPVVSEGGGLEYLNGCQQSSVQPKCWGAKFYLFKFKDKGQARVNKEDSATVTPQGDADLAGAEFLISNSNDSTTVTIENVDGSYTSLSQPIRSGSYTVTETKTPTGYKKAADATVSVPAGGIGEVTVKDDIITGGVEVVKADAGFKASEEQGNGQLNAEYTIYNNSKADVKVNGEMKGHADSNSAANEVMKITASYDSSRQAWIAKTAANALPYGHYTIKETKAPTGYHLSGFEKKFSIGYALSGMDANTTDDQQMVSFSNSNVSAKDGWNEDVVWRGDIELIKYDDTLKRSEPQGNSTLENVQFDIINRSAHAVQSPEDPTKKIQPGQVVCRITTKKVGNVYKASTAATDVNQKSSGSGTWNTPSDWDGALAYGEYQLKEVVVPDGEMLGKWNGNTQKIWNGAASQNGQAASSWGITGTDEVHSPDGQLTWINENKALVKFDEQTSGPNNTVMRGDIDVQKVDEELQRTEHDTDIQDRQGMARLDGCILGVYNRSQNVVVSPVNGDEIQPGDLICTITTDMDGIASTELTAARAQINGWGADCFAIQNGWHGALAYGEYEVIEQIPSEGYMLNKTWHGMAVDYTVSSPKSPIINWPAHEGATKESIKPNTDATWINADKVRVSFGNKTYSDDAANKVSWLPEQVIRGGVRVGKVDRQNQMYKAQGKASLENHVIAIYSRNLHPVLIHEISSEKSNRATASEIELPAWNPASTAQSAAATTMALGTQTRDGVLVAYLNTKQIEENGQIKYIAETDVDTLPYGIYRIKEVFVPSKSGYLFDQVSADWYEDFAIGSDFSTREFANQTAWQQATANFKNDETYHTTVTQTEQKNDRTYVDLTNDPKYCLSNYVLRGDVTIHKKADNTDSDVLQFVPFVIVSKTTGEAHIVVADKNGDATTIINHQASTLQNDETGEILGYTLHTFNTNKNDKGVLAIADGATAPALALDKTSENGLADISTIVTLDSQQCVLDSEGKTPEFQWAYGVWFDGRVDVVTANPRLTWQNADWPAGGSNYIAVEAEVSNVDNALGALPFDDYIVFELRVPEHEVTDIVDGETFTVRGNYDMTMVSAGTFSITTNNGEYVNAPNSASRVDKDVIGWSNPTQADIRTGRYPQKVDFDNQQLLGLGTTLTDADENHIFKANGEITLYDTVEYDGAEIGETYTLEGKLILVGTDAEGNKTEDSVIAEGSTTFTADKASGSAVVEFTFDSNELAGHSLVAYEYLYKSDGALAGLHEDINDEGQTVSIADMRTTLTGDEGEKEIRAYEPVKLIDTISYKGLIPNKEYTATGTLHVKNADGTDGGAVVDAEGNEVTASTTFTAEAADGTVQVVFEFDAALVAGKIIVAFEEMSQDGVVFMTHADINDEAQTVYCPDICTTALDGITADHLGLAEGEITINDIVAYFNLVKGRTYTIDGTLMDRLTGEAIKFAEGDVVKGTKTFVAGYNDDGTEDTSATVTTLGDIELVSGTVSVPFHPNAEDVKGKATVVFEELYVGDKPDTPEGDHEIEISKTDITTGEELPGALLIIVHEGKIVEEWISGETPHTVKLDEGTYELTEVTAPKGYEVAETIEFTVDENGLVDGEKVEMKDQPVDVPEGDIDIEISKTDMTTGEELPGATLVIVQDGVTIDEWVSEETPHTVKLEEGTYDLVEITAPDGYEKAETITFKVGPEGLVEGDKVEMKDAPENDKPVAIHEDLNDDNQSVNYPEIRTMAHVNGAKENITAAGEVHLIDTVSYTNLIPGRTYTMEGLLMDKVTGQPALTPEGQQITGTASFVPEAANGTVDMEFVFNARALQYHETVVFENLYTMHAEVADEVIHVAKHEDITDADQTVKFGEDDIADDLITSTGDETANLIVIIAAAVVALGGAAAIRRRNTK